MVLIIFIDIVYHKLKDNYMVAFMSCHSTMLWMDGWMDGWLDGRMDG